MFAELGISPPGKVKGSLLSVRLTDEDAQTLDALAQHLGVRGRSTMARLVLEKFAADHRVTKGKK